MMSTGDKRSSVKREMTSREWRDDTTTDVGSTETPFDPATILVTACPALGQEKQWEQSLGELMRASLSFPGHLGTTVLFRSWLYPKPNRIIGVVTEQQSEKETQDVERL